MKQIKNIATHPLLIVLVFSGIIISGEQMGGFYLLYIILGLPHLVLHSLFGIGGIICLLYAYYKKTVTVSLFRIIGSFLMIASLLYFFFNQTAVITTAHFMKDCR